MIPGRSAPEYSLRVSPHQPREPLRPLPWNQPPLYGRKTQLCPPSTGHRCIPAVPGIEHAASCDSGSEGTNITTNDICFNIHSVARFPQAEGCVLQCVWDECDRALSSLQRDNGERHSIECYGSLVRYGRNKLLRQLNGQQNPFPILLQRDYLSHPFHMPLDHVPLKTIVGTQGSLEVHTLPFPDGPERALALSFPHHIEYQRLRIQFDHCETHTCYCNAGTHGDIHEERRARERKPATVDREHCCRFLNNPRKHGKEVYTSPVREERKREEIQKQKRKQMCGKNLFFPLPSPLSRAIDPRQGALFLISSSSRSCFAQGVFF